jgi:hypothetical protein
MTGEGHHFVGLDTINHLLSKSVAWMHRHWGTYEDVCTIGGRASTTTTLPPITSGAAAHDAYTYFMAALVLAGMQVFTLGVWVQFKV